MLADSERGKSLAGEMTASTSTELSYADGGLITLLKRWPSSWHLSGPCLLLGSLIVFSPLIEGGTTHLPVLIIRLVLLSAVITWILRNMKLGTLVLCRSSLVPLIAVFLGWAGLSLWWSPYKNASVQWLISLLIYALFFSVVLQGVQSGKHARQLVTVLLGMGICEGVLGIIQYFMAGEARAMGTFFNPNFFATYEVAIFAIALGYLAFIRQNELRWQERAFLWGAVAITFCAFMLAQSRGALLAFGTAMTFIGLYRFGKIAVVIMALSLVAGITIPNPLKQRIVEVSAQDPYAYSRLDMWRSSLERIVDRPSGIGLGMYKYTSFQYRFPIEQNIVRYGKRAESAHNEYLQLAVELGVGGLAIFLIGIGMWGREVKGVLRGRLEPSERGLVIGLTGAVLGILVHSAVDSVFHEPALVLLLILTGALVLAFKSFNRPEEASWWRVPLPYHPGRVALIVVCGIVLGLLIIQPSLAWYAHERGESESQAGRNDRALDWFGRASVIDPGTTAYHDDVARVAIQLFHQSGDSEWLLKAVEEESLSIELNPLDGRFPYRLGTLYGLLSGQKVPAGQRDLFLTQAATSHERAIQVDPYSPFNYFELGKIRLHQGRLDEARTWLSQASTYEPNFLPARALLAELSLRTGKSVVARSEYNAMVTIKRQFEGRILSETERQFLDVDLYPLGRALALESK